MRSRENILEDDGELENSAIMEASIFWRMLYAYSKSITEPYQSSERISDFLKTTWNDNVRKFRWAIVGISLAWGVVGITNTSNLTGLTWMDT